MNLSFPPIEPVTRTMALPDDLAVMMVGIAARQAASPTALFFARARSTPAEQLLLAPVEGAFNHAVALSLRRQGEAQPRRTEE